MEANEQELANVAAAHRQRAAQCLEAGDIDSAIEAYEQALEAEPDLDTTRYLADLFAQRGADGDAEQAADLYFTIGDVLGNPDGVALLQRALELVPGHVDALTLLASFAPPAPAPAAASVAADARAVPAPRSGRTVVGYRALPEAENQELKTLDGKRIPSTPAPAPLMAAAPISVPPVGAVPSVRASSPPSSASAGVVRSSSPPMAASVAPVRSSWPPTSAGVAAQRPSRAPIDPFAPAAPGTSLSRASTKPARPSAPPKTSSVAPVLGSKPASLPPAAEPMPVSVPAVSRRSAPPPAIEIGGSDDAVELAPTSGKKSKRAYFIGGGVALAAAAAAAFSLSSPAAAPASVPVSSASSAASSTAVAAASAAPAPAPVPAVAPTPAAPVVAPAPEPAAITPPPSAAAPAEPDVRALVDLASMTGGKLTDKQLASAFDKADEKLERCYDAALAKKPRTEGRLTLTWTVSKSGRTVGVKKLGGTIKDAALDKCTVQAVKTLRFPKPRRAVKVKLPLEYSRS